METLGPPIRFLKLQSFIIGQILPNIIVHSDVLSSYSLFEVLSKGDATTSTIVHESTIFTINVQLSTIIVTVFLIVTIIVDKCTLIVKMVDSCTIVIVVASPLVLSSYSMSKKRHPSKS